MFALLILNVERYLALTCPFFHQASITKRIILYVQALFIVATIGASLVQHFKDIRPADNILIAVFQSLLLVLFISSNYRLFLIAKSKRGDERVAPIATTSAGNDKKNRILNLKNISTCSLAVGCFFVCSCPQMIYSVLRFMLEEQPYDGQILLFNLWSSTFLSMNSTFNCLIFFWRNSILRREGKKFIDAFQRHLFN